MGKPFVAVAGFSEVTQPRSSRKKHDAQVKAATRITSLARGRIARRKDEQRRANMEERVTRLNLGAKSAGMNAAKFLAEDVSDISDDE